MNAIWAFQLALKRSFAVLKMPGTENTLNLDGRQACRKISSLTVQTDFQSSFCLYDFT